jgi:hypothetical protein
MKATSFLFKKNEIEIKSTLVETCSTANVDERGQKANIAEIKFIF